MSSKTSDCTAVTKGQVFAGAGKDFPNREILTTLLEAQVLAEYRQKEYNRVQAHRLCAIDYSFLKLG